MGKKIAGLIATTAGVGYLPLAPGTWAAALSACAWFILTINLPHAEVWQASLAILITLAGVYCSGIILTDDNKDPSFVVIDEFAGMWVSMLFIPPSVSYLVIGFILFRFFDIVKPFGIKKMEKFKNGWGIMNDDLLAGLYSNLILQILVFFKI